MHDTLVDDLPQVLALDVPQALACATRHDLPRLIRQMGQTMDFEDLTFNQDPQGKVPWFPEGHPVDTLIQGHFDGDIDRCGTDLTLSEVVMAMAGQGQSEDLFRARHYISSDRSELPLAHVLSWYGMPNALSNLIDVGWDLDVKDGQGRTAEEFALEGFVEGSAAVLNTDEECLHLLRSARARQTALQSVLDLPERRHRPEM